MYQLPELVVWTIYSYLKTDTFKLKFIKKYNSEIINSNITITLTDGYPINTTLDYLALGYKIKL
jgi:hypothetical protein